MLDRFDPKLDPTFAETDRARLIARLKAVLPADGLLTTPEAMRGYESNGLAAYRGLPALVAPPRAAEEVRLPLAHCHELRVPAVPPRASHRPTRQPLSCTRHVPP